MSEIKVFAKDYPMAPIDKFIPYANNARTHSKEQIKKLRPSWTGYKAGEYYRIVLDVEEYMGLG